MQEKAEVRFSLRVASRTIDATARVPQGPAHLVEIVPVIHQITSAIVQVGVEEVLEEGKSISCRAGCGACCRQMVPVTQAEAYYLMALVRSLPQERRDHVLSRFLKIMERLEETGLAGQVRQIGQFDSQDRLRIGSEYFWLGLPCPFLEDEACSIYPYRPSVCREYMVTSPAENCSEPTRDRIEPVPLYAKPVRAMGELMTGGDGPEEPMPYMALVYSLEWADAHPLEAPCRTGVELLQKFLKKLAGVDGAGELPGPVPQQAAHQEETNSGDGSDGREGRGQVQPPGTQPDD